MVKQVTHIINENERSRILGLYDLKEKKRDYIFEACMTVNDRFFILHDDVFDIQEQKSLGNIWSSIDTFKTIFKNVDIENNEEYTQIKENIISLPLLENNDNLYVIRDFLLEWNFFDDTWLGNKLKDAGTAIKDTAIAGWEGLKKLGVAISKGEWSEIMSLLGKGVIWILRKLKDALYSTLGMIVDAILIATGIGETVQWIPWALITALDAYQISTNNWPENEKDDPMWLKLIFFGIDILGLVSTGAIALSAKKTLQPISDLAKTSPEKVTDYIRKNAPIRNFLLKIKNAILSVPSKMKSAQTYIAKTFPKGSEFISNIMGGLSNILKRLDNSLVKILGDIPGMGTSAGLKTAGVLYGAETTINKLTGVSGQQLKNLEKMDDIIKTKYGGKDPFDL